MSRLTPIDRIALTTRVVELLRHPSYCLRQSENLFRRHSKFYVSWLTLGVWLLGSAAANGQDNVFLHAGAPVRGEIVDSTNSSVIVETEKGRSEVQVQNIRNIKFANEPQECERARRAYEGRKYDEGLLELEKIATVPEAKMLANEIEYLKALGNAKSALSSGNVTAKTAGTVVSNFLKKSPETFHFFELTELLGQLLVAIGRTDLAEAEFARLANSSLPQYQIKGSFALGQSQVLGGKGAEAEKNFAAVIESGLNDDATARMKNIAKCLKAKAVLLQGRVEEAQASIEKIIKAEDPSQIELFANAYNTMGLVHLAKGEDLPAALAFLHTDLLFSNQGDAHAEALYQLALLWPKLGKNDKALETRTTLKSLYRNSVWAAKLDQ